MTIVLPRWLLISVFIALCLSVTACIYFWQDLSHLVAPYESQLKILSLVLGPVATIASIYWGYKSKHDLVDHSTRQAEEFSRSAEVLRREIGSKSEALGEARVRAENAQSAAAAKQQEIEAAEVEMRKQGAEIEKLQSDLKRLTEGAQELWKLRPEFTAFSDYELWHSRQVGAKILTVANLKGGVGKTTLAANLAAYVSQKYGASVLLVDLDYQGSLSNMMMQAAGKELVESLVDSLLIPSEESALVRLSRARVQLEPVLPRVWMVPASYTLAQVENQLLLKWLLNANEGIDVRFRLARVLLESDVRREYKLIILDTPPRMTIGTINALVASHYFVVPTALDKLSSEAVPQFMTNMKAIKKDLKLGLELGGIAGMMSRVAKLSDNELLALGRAREGGYIWEPGKDFVLRKAIPRRTGIADAAGESVAYFGRDADNLPLAELFDPLFAEICENMRIE